MAGIVFLGVPYCRADLGSWTSFSTRIINVLKRANKDIVEVLKLGSEMLRVVEKNFYNILRLRKEEGSKISIIYFYKELPIIGIREI